MTPGTYERTAHHRRKISKAMRIVHMLKKRSAKMKHRWVNLSHDERVAQLRQLEHARAVRAAKKAGKHVCKHGVTPISTDNVQLSIEMQNRIMDTVLARVVDRLADGIIARITSK